VISPIVTIERRRAFALMETKRVRERAKGKLISVSAGVPGLPYLSLFLLGCGEVESNQG
jgi:hypothetical protein